MNDKIDNAKDRSGKPLAWALSGAFAAAAVTCQEAAWMPMWMLAAAIFFAVKAFVMTRGDREWQFVLLWPGMDAAAFSRPATSRDVSGTWWRLGLINALFGLFLMLGAGRVGDRFVATWIAMVALIFFLHCGVFTMLTAYWRGRGRDVVPIMNNPIAARSVTEFWGSRWNLAFSDAAHQLLVRPLMRRIGVGFTLFIVFAVSGVVHEAVISMPARGGYGGPLCYFIIQGLAMLWERGCPIPRGWFWRLRAWAVLVLPLPLLFHKTFVMNVMAPFFETLGVIQ